LPAASAEARINVAMLSCQMYCHMDRADGFQIYESIQNSAPDFLLSCGDNVYYDNEDPIANTPAVARYHWQRMYSLSTLRNCLRNVGGFWQKDDHDTLVDDVWPTMRSGRMAPLSFIEGQRIFRQQVPAPPPDQPLYRRVRAGKNLEFFLTEARDYRSANTDADGPDKTIFGREQVEWLRKALAESDAQFKVVVNPNPMVGPDRVNKKDNHANQSFAAEGRALRKLLAQETPGIVVAVCGDRHWQFHSVDPESGLHEFCCGAASDEHAGGTPGHNPDLHRFHRVKGGYLWFSLEGAGRNASLTLTHRDVRGQALHTHKFSV
jgi:alkaline phosphatase D